MAEYKLKTGKAGEKVAGVYEKVVKKFKRYAKAKDGVLIC